MTSNHLIDLAEYIDSTKRFALAISQVVDGMAAVESSWISAACRNCVSITSASSM